MSRNIEISINEFYHLYNRGVEKKEIFRDLSDYRRFLTLLYLSNSDTVIHRSDFSGMSDPVEIFKTDRGSPLIAIGAYCLMPNHFHLLCREVIAGGMSSFMLKLGTAYSMYINKKYNRTGTLFESRFKAKHLDTDRYLKYQYAYIHLNPVKLIQSDWKEAGIKDFVKAKKFLSNFEYSSLLDYLSGHERFQSKILSPDVFPDYFNSPSSHLEELNSWLYLSRPGLDNRI